jgi:CRP-like cAMP-binding protein
VGLSGILGGRTASVRSVTETPVTLLSIDAQDFLDVLEDQFAVFLQLRSAYAANVVRLQRRLGVFHTLGPAPALVLPPHDRPLGIVEQLLFLRRTRAFRALPINLLAELIRDERELRIPAGEPLWHDGDPGALLIAIVHGQVRCSSQGTQEEDGERGPSGKFVAGPGYVLGADAAFGGIPYAYDAVAESDVVAVGVSATALTDMIEDHFELGRRSLAHFAQEDVRLQERRAGVGDAQRDGM